MSDLPQGYQEIPEQDRKRAKAFFDKGKVVADTGNYDYAIEMFITGLTIDPDAVEAHQQLREISLKRKATGGKDMGFLEKRKWKTTTSDDKQNMLSAERLLAYEPGTTDLMVTILQNAHRAGYFDTVMWIGPILQKANADSVKPGPDLAKFLILKDVYKALRQWKEATDACHYAVMIRPDDMDLQTELKNLGAQLTMSTGKYGKAKSFRDSVRDSAGQERIREGDRDVRSMDSLARGIADAEKELAADPNEPGKLMKLVDALLKTEQADNENRAIELLDEAYQKTRQFRFRHAAGRIKLLQLNRMERTMRTDLQANPNDAEKKKDYQMFLRERAQEELKEYALWSENYPTDTTMRYEMAKRMFQLGQFGDVIPVLQQIRSDPKHRAEAGTFLGRAFLESEFVDEAVDTLKEVIDTYNNKGDLKSKDMFYWYARALEAKNDAPAAIKAYSQVAQWDFNYRDVQVRIKKLRNPTPGA